jgi:hypothetical protein
MIIFFKKTESTAVNVSAGPLIQWASNLGGKQVGVLGY